MIFDRLLNEIKITPKFLTELKETLTKEHGREFNEEEVLAVAELMYKMAGWTVDVMLEEQRRKQKLKDFPTGYEFDKDGYCCLICGHSASLKNGWYDRYGLKCRFCQYAVEQKIIPGRITGNEESYYSEFDLEHYFNVNRKAQMDWIKKGLLKERTVPGENGRGKHYRVFLMSDHKGFLPPKKMLRFGDRVTETIDGKEYQRTLPWYQSCDPFLYLKKYGIMGYLKYKEPQAEKQ